VKARIFIEGGGESKELRTRCRMGFRRLLEKCGLEGNMPRLVACGGRDEVFEDFTRAHAHAGSEEFVAMLVDSEAPVKNKDKPWEHLKRRDGWERPEGATDGQVLLMITCMETWIAADGRTLRKFFGQCLRENALPATPEMESRPPDAVQKALIQATRDCGKRRYAKGAKSFEIVGKLDPKTLRRDLPGFRRVEAILREKLRG
jgi:hypothetical protein